ncbi:MAG: HEPN domain-containing protein [Anaerolineales bacterium]|nr:MAG: HEPN domain-containing protein [Anaerolineales bacterium]
MSQSKNRYHAKRWLRTAEEDLEAAKVLLDAGMYAQACFYAQQSGEKAIKSLWYLVDADPWGHSVQRLIAEFPWRTKVPNLEVWIERGALLDKFYIPTRYPNGLPDLTPGQVYRQEDARRGIEAARALAVACEKWLEEH